MDLKCIFSLVIIVSRISLSFTQIVNVVIQGSTSVAETDDNFDLKKKVLINATKDEFYVCEIKSFNSLRIKVGGSLQDQVVYGVGEVKNCLNFMIKEDSLFGFSQGCLPVERWDELNKFFNQTGWVTFGLNALLGRNESQSEKGLWVGDWNSQNARDFMKYTISRGYKVDSYEFGNQLFGAGMGARNMVKELHQDPKTQPKVLGPSGFYDEKWFNSFLEVLGQEVVEGVTHHIYNLGPTIQIYLDPYGDDLNLITNIQEPSYLNQAAQTYRGVFNIVNKFKPQSGAWVSESGGALQGGAKDVSPTFADGFWFSAGKLSFGGNYALLKTTTFISNPDYYGSLLWHRLMENIVLAVTQESQESNPKKKPGTSIIFVNLLKDSSFDVTLSSYEHHRRYLRSTDAAKPNFEFKSYLHTEEYHLAVLGGNIQGQIMLLNVLVNASTAISVAAHSIVYETIRDFHAPVCV
ncbi:hypothetical protein E1A91_D09G003900v1 [Gossypium mustelinum]|uniref:Beta-glucuronidase C-terminal domain-containing protein n=1 Tax=Gossypium mustelinum TaxID=34275 RepID=A0A5D2TCX3_GOSMU|nr:hypothetical protein E1A91_D09G003900v1 [Gossypium mustelinum]